MQVKLIGNFSEEVIEKFKEKGGMPMSLREGSHFTPVQIFTFDQEKDVDSQIREIFSCINQLECSYTKLQENLNVFESSLNSFPHVLKEELSKTLILNKLYDIKQKYELLIKLSKIGNQDYSSIEVVILDIQSRIGTLVELSLNQAFIDGNCIYAGSGYIPFFLINVLNIYESVTKIHQKICNDRCNSVPEIQKQINEIAEDYRVFLQKIYKTVHEYKKILYKNFSKFFLSNQPAQMLNPSNYQNVPIPQLNPFFFEEIENIEAILVQNIGNPLRTVTIECDDRTISFAGLLSE